jgi:hypothetical protein
MVVMFTPDGNGLVVKSVFRYSHWHILLPDVGVAFIGQELAPPVYVGLEPGKIYIGCALARPTSKAVTRILTNTNCWKKRGKLLFFMNTDLNKMDNQTK